MTNGAAGVLFSNNTILTETVAGSSANAHWRNNLLLGENFVQAIFSVNTKTNYSSSDYNGFRPGVLADYVGLVPAASSAGTPRSSALETRRFTMLADYSRITHQDVHSVIVDYDVFVNLSRLDRSDLTKVQTVYKAEDFDFRLKPGSAAVDRGMVLPNVTDGFGGQAPDLGALESGQPPPQYGPRP